MTVCFSCAGLGSATAQPGGPPPSQPASESSATRLTIPAFWLRESSGTAWVPDETPMYGVMQRWAGWDVMLHGNLFVQVLWEGTDRHRTGGASRQQASSANWGMVMARRPVGAARLGLRTMLTVEPWSVADCGFLNLLATAEVCEGDTIHDRQHPHDLFMELAIDYDRPIGAGLRWQVYGGVSGEPALGPPGFPHRLPAFPNPLAPITHHWLDSTHISFGLITTGVYSRRWKAEVSAFNGREPDDMRADFDLDALDSLSARLSWMPTSRWALQVSGGHLRDAESEPGLTFRGDLTRVTASAIHQRQVAAEGLWTSMLAYGLNAGPEIVSGKPHDTTTHAVLVESALTRAERHTWFGRAEVVGKPAHDLHAHEFTTQVFTVAKLEAGYVRHLPRWGALLPGAGVVGSLNVVPEALEPRYDGRVVPGVGLFFTLRPTRHIM